MCVCVCNDVGTLAFGHVHVRDQKGMISMYFYRVYHYSGHAGS